jgi:type IV pilus assembly protein PilA
MSKLLRKSKKGFTLIELMIVVAIIGILAAIAIPNFLRFQLKSKTSEAKVNLAAIRTAEESYLAEFGSYVVAAASPAVNGGSQKQTFVDVGVAGAKGYVHEDPNAAVVVGALSCSGAYDPVTAMADVVNTVGPCGANFGQSEF